MLDLFRETFSISVRHVIANRERGCRCGRRSVENVDASVGSLDSEIITGVSIGIEKHRSNSGSALADIVDREGGNKVLERF